MTFEQAHEEFIRSHLARRTGERKDRLARGHRHAETMFMRNVWWPLMRHFQNLHPEYEVADWRGRPYFADFAWLSGNVRLLIEIKGFGPHVVDMDRRKFCIERNRETFLTAMGYQVISFAYDDVDKNPELCIALLRMTLGRFRAGETSDRQPRPVEKEAIRLAVRLARPVRSKDLIEHLKISRKTALNLMKTMCEKGYLIPTGGHKQQRVTKYSLTPAATEQLD